MMISQEFEFFAPRDLGAALALLEEHGAEARPLAGGMTLVPMMTLGLAQPAVVISLNHITGLDDVADAGDSLRIGAMTRHATLASHPLVRRHCPILADAASVIGDRQVRHRGTIGGSLCHADPAADYPPVMLAVGARIKLRGSGGERIVAAADFFTGLMQTDVRPGELLTEIMVPKLADHFAHSFLRLHRVEGSFAIVNAAALIERNFGSARLAIGGVGATAIALDAGRHLSAGLTDDAVRRIADDAYSAAKDAPDDLNGSAGYRRAMARVYAERAIRDAAAAVGTK
jgi:aerobic carbon-monoxide dehydrogenase medium subunit